MSVKPTVCLAAIALMLMGAIAWADQIVLKDGTVYSGKFVRGDSNVVEFRILGRVESFKVGDIAQIVFKEPELESSSARTTAALAGPAQIPLTPQRAGAPPEPAPAPAPVAPGSGITLPTGTPITIRTSTGIDTERNRVGDVFDATLEQPLVWGNQTIFPRGTAVKGRIAYAQESGKLTGQDQLVLELTEIAANGKSYFLRTANYTEAGANRGNRTAATVGGTAALGAVIGAIAGHGTGAAVGAASGAAVGTGVQVMTKGPVLKIPAETILEFRLQSPMPVDAP